MTGPWMGAAAGAKTAYQYNGIEHVDDFDLNVNMAMYRTLDPTTGRWWSVDPAAEASKALSPYNSMHNSPVRYNDPNGDFIPAAILGAGIGLVTNGLNNLASGENFFQGGIKAAAFGALGGAVSFGIGQAAGAIAQAGGSGLGVAAFQTGAHALSGGGLSALQGGSFGAGALSGAFSSGISSGASALGVGQAGMIALGGLSGGVGSSLAGGSFWKGVGQGLITSGLNHAAHSGIFGEGLAASLLTGRMRHILGPDATGFFGSGDVAVGGGAHAQKTGVLIRRGKQSGKMFSVDESGLHAGLELGGSVGSENYYYSGKVSQFTVSNLQGYSWQTNISVGIGTLDAGGSFSYARSGPNNSEYVLGYGVDIGWSPLPVKISGTAGYYHNRISTPNEFRWFQSPLRRR